MRLLDRYVIRNFLQVYLYCIAGFISIWLIFDVSDNISTFLDERISQRGTKANRLTLSREARRRSAQA